MYPILLATYLIYNDFLEKRVNVKCSVFFMQLGPKTMERFLRGEQKNVYNIPKNGKQAKSLKPTYEYTTERQAFRASSGCAPMCIKNDHNF